jgi:hypothetical protein
LPRWMPSELPRSKEALVFAWGANASASPLFPAGGETDWRIRSTGPQDSFSVVADVAQPPGQRRTCAYRKIKPEHIGDAVHPGSDGTECVRCRFQARQSRRSPSRLPVPGPSSFCRGRRPPAYPIEPSLCNPNGAGAVRLNHPPRDLVRSIGVCPASPPTPYSRAGALF